MKSKRNNLLLILTFILITLSCNLFSTTKNTDNSSDTENKTSSPETENQGILSETSNQPPTKLLSEADVWLNGEKVGSLNDLSKLESILSKEIKEREKTGVLMEGTNETIKTVYLFADPNISLDSFWNIAESIKNGGGRLFIPRKNQEKFEPTELSKKYLYVVHITEKDKKPEQIDLPIDDRLNKYHYEIGVRRDEKASDIRYSRIMQNSIEINQSNKYFVNEKAKPGKNVFDSNVRQRALKTVDIGKEMMFVYTQNREPLDINEEPTVSNSPNDSKSLDIIVDKNASYESILKLFDAGDPLDFSFYNIKIISNPDK